MKRKSRKCVTILGSLRDDDNNMILGEVADDYARNGEDFSHPRQWCRGKCAPREHDAVDSAEAECSLEVRHNLPRRRRRPISARGEMSVTGRTDEGQSRRVVGRGLSCAASALERCQDHEGSEVSLLGRGESLRRENKTGQITNLFRQRNVWMLDMWVKRLPDAMDGSSFQRLGR